MYRVLFALLITLIAWSAMAVESTGEGANNVSPEQSADSDRAGHDEGHYDEGHFDEELAKSLGADDYGMRSYVLVILRSGPTPVPEGPARKSMFQGHFDNMKRLAEEGQLALAGPLDGVKGRRGIFILAVPDIDAAKAAVATDPVIQNGEMVADFHMYYGSAALMQVGEVHKRIARKEI